jgi:hypothetical protein
MIHFDRVYRYLCVHNLLHSLAPLPLFRLDLLGLGDLY